MTNITQLWHASSTTTGGNNCQPPIPSGAQWCNDCHPALARIIRRYWRQQLPASDTERYPMV
ncbi:MAG: hypothetical protein ACI3VA_12340 [Candidatus Limivicinus sp.]